MANAKEDLFSSLEVDTIGEIMNISMGSAATAASTLLDSKVSITTPVVKVVDMQSFEIKSLEPAVAVDIKYIEGLSGSNMMILREKDVKVILSRMMQMEIPEDAEMDEMAQSAVCELMNQMMGSSATVLSCFLGRQINISTPDILPSEQFESLKETYFRGHDTLITIAFTLRIEDVIESEFLCAMDTDLAKEIIDVSLNFESPEEPEPVVAPPSAVQPPVPEIPMPQAVQAPVPPAPVAPPIAPPPAASSPGAMPMAPAQSPNPYAVPTQHAGYNPYPAPPPVQQYGYAPPQAPAQPHYAEPSVQVQPYAFNDFSSAAGSDKTSGANIDLVLDVPVTVTVELGRTKKKIRDILDFGQGTIVELDKQAGSHVDVIANGQLIARGDVVVVDDNFSIRITEILKNRNALNML